MIQFLLDDQIHSVNELAPSLTLLQYLRLELVQTGTKEGCAAGDCGACTVAVGSPIGGSIHYQAINACITPLASIHGKHLVTVESLTRQSEAQFGGLHPVQQAMVDCHGSQCGFCTPGFIMSLFAWWMNVKSGACEPSRHSIEIALAGNLCRCTGYQPILRAAETSLQSDLPSTALAIQADVLKLLRTIQTQGPGSLTCGQTHFFSPTTSQELTDLLTAYPQARLVAGATDLGLEFTQQLKTPEVLIYTANVQEMQQLSDAKNQLVIGAAVTYSAMQPLLNKYLPAFGELLDRLGSLQIRNQGTLGGNIANGSPIGDTPPVLLALNATLNLVGPNGKRQLPIQDFFLGYRQTALAEGEAIESVIIPKLGNNEYLNVYKISKRFDDDISAVCMAIWLRFDEAYSDNTPVTEVRIGCGGMAATPLRACAAERAIKGNSLSNSTLATAKLALTQDFTPLDDVRASAKYRLAVAGNLLLRCQQELSDPGSQPLWAWPIEHKPITHPTDAAQNRKAMYVELKGGNADV